MAEAIGISPSYLNLIERNQRPLTVQLILKLAATFKIDLEDLQGEAAASRTCAKCSPIRCCPPSCPGRKS